MAHSNNTKMHTYGITDISLEQAEELGFGPELWDIEGWVLLRYGALLKWVTVLAFRGIEGGFGWWGGLTHLLELGVPGGSELRVGSSQRGSLLMDRSVVPFRCMSGSKGKSTCQLTSRKNCVKRLFQSMTLWKESSRGHKSPYLFRWILSSPLWLTQTSSWCGDNSCPVSGPPDL